MGTIHKVDFWEKIPDRISNFSYFILKVNPHPKNIGHMTRAFVSINFKVNFFAEG